MRIKLLDKFDRNSLCFNSFKRGQKDVTLLNSLIKTGPSHRKFLRLIRIFEEVSLDELQRLLMDRKLREKIKYKPLSKHQSRSGLAEGRYLIQYSGETAYVMSENTESNNFEGLFNAFFSGSLIHVFTPKFLADAVRSSRESYRFKDTTFNGKCGSEYMDRAFKKEEEYDNQMFWYFFEIEAPLYVFKHVDTYKLDTVSLSSSTMYTLTSSKLKDKDFGAKIFNPSLSYINELIDCHAAQENRKERANTEDILFNNLPSGFIQKRFWYINGQVIEDILEQRRKHKVKKWKIICDVLERVLV